MDQNNTKLLQKGHLAVGGGHQLYFETHGNPDGVPTLYLHGGPGVGFSDKDLLFFDLASSFVVLLDQRGSGKSIPQGSLEHNTTQKLVEDISKLLDFLEVDRVILFGGSWGSTLALLYGIKCPDRVLGMVIRGIFLATPASIQFFISEAVAQFFPEAWKRFNSMVPEGEDLLAFYLRMMQSSDEATRKKYAYEWSRYGFIISRLEVSEEEVDRLVDPNTFRSSSFFVAYYASHDCFLPDNYILDHADRIQDLPIRITHGRYDLVCPPIYAQQLHKRLQQSTLSFVTAGHSPSEPAIVSQMKRDLQVMIENLKQGNV